MTLARDEAGGLAAASARVWVFTVLPKQRIVQSLACFVSGGTRSAVTGQGFTLSWVEYEAQTGVLRRDKDPAPRVTTSNRDYAN